MKVKKQKSTKSESQSPSRKPKLSTTLSTALDDLNSAGKLTLIKRKAENQRAIAAMQRLDLDPSDVEALPQITESINSVFGTGQNGGMKRVVVLNYLAASPAPAAIRFMETYRLIPKKDAENLPIEAVCLKAEVPPLEILGALAQAAVGVKKMESALKLAIAHPDIVQASIEAAKEKGGFGDRQMLNQVIGFLPTKQGQNIAINLLGGGQAQVATDEATEEDDAWDRCFPSISAKMEQWSDKRRLLTEGK